MKVILLYLLLLPALTTGQIKVGYKVFYSDKLAEDGLKVLVSYTKPNTSDSTYFHFTNELWGEKDLINCVKFNKNENPNYQFKIVPDSNRIIVYHPLSKKVNFYYHIKFDGDNTNKGHKRPRVENEYFYILGQSLFTVPETVFSGNNEDPVITANIEWVGFPVNFKIHNTFATQQNKQELKVKLWTEFYNSLFAGGDFRIHSFTYENKPVYFAIRGIWFKEYTDTNLLTNLKRVISSQRKFWKDNKFDYYTVIMIPSFTQNDSIFKGQSINGSCIHNGFVVQATNSVFNNWNLITYIFNHEMMHEWIGIKIKTKSEELNYWFSEGFTDYYSYKNRLRNGEFTLEKWLEKFNKEIIKSHWENPEKNKPNYVLKDNFWISRNIEKIPYRRGAVFAFWLDNQIMKTSNYKLSLDNLMRELLSICTKENKKFSDELFLDIVQKYLNADITWFFQKHIITGEDFNFGSNELINGFNMNYSDKIPKLTIVNASDLKYITLDNKDL